MNIFSAIPRSDPSPAVHGDSQFQFLDRVSGHYWDQIRDLLENWFSRLCPDAQADVRGRLRSKDDRQFNGAFFELYLHECLLRMGYFVTCHPNLEGTNRRPDFLAEKHGRSIYLEARSASSSDTVVGAAARRNMVYESLDKLDSPNFFLWIDVVDQGDTSLGAGSLRRRLEKWLGGLDPDDYQIDKDREDLPSFTYVHPGSGWNIEFRAIPKSVEARGKKGVRPLGVFGGGRAELVKDEEGIRNALTDKGAAYGRLGASFVVAVASSPFSAGDDDVLNALYGTEVLEIRTASDGTEQTPLCVSLTGTGMRVTTGITGACRPFSLSSTSTLRSSARSSTRSGSTLTQRSGWASSPSGGDPLSEPMGAWGSPTLSAPRPSGSTWATLGPLARPSRGSNVLMGAC